MAGLRRNCKLLAIAAVLLLSGCGAEQSPAADLTQYQAPQLSGNEIVTTATDQLQLRQPTGVVKVSWQNLGVRSAAWLTTGQTIVTANTQADVYTLHLFNVQTGTDQLLQASKTAYTDLLPDPLGQLIAYRQDGDVFVVVPSSGAIFRVAEDITDVTWIPDQRSLIVASARGAERVALGPDGRVASRLSVIDGQPVLGVRVVEQQLYAVVQSATEHTLQRITLTAIHNDAVSIATLRQDDGLPSADYQLYLSADNSQILISQPSSQRFEVRRVSDGLSLQESSGQGIGWLDDQTIVLTLPDHAGSVFTMDVRSGTLHRLAESIESLTL